MKIQYYLKRGYFGDKGKVYLPTWKAYLHRWFTDICVFCEINNKEIWINATKKEWR